MYKPWHMGKTMKDKKIVQGGMNMNNRRISRMNREKIVMIASSLLIVTACALTGVYINGRGTRQVQEKIVDFKALEDETDLTLTEMGDSMDGNDQAAVDIGTGQEVADQDLDLDPAYQETGSSSVLSSAANGNPDEAPLLAGDDSDEEGAGENAGEEKEDPESSNDASGDLKQQEKEPAAETMSSKAAVFHEGDQLAWPVKGDVLMNYSMDKTTYFATLEQYKYNPALIIQGDVGANVVSPVEGTVKEAGESSELGKYVIMDLGGGYELTLGQLANLTIGSGDTVKKEQKIGTVAEPSKYYSVEGSNIYLKLTRNGESLNPMNYLN